MRNFIIILVLSCFSLHLKAQRFSFDVTGGYTNSDVKWETFEKFRTSYNSALTPVSMLQPFKSTGYNFGAQWRVGALFLGLQYDRALATSSAAFHFNEERKFYFGTSLLSTEIGLIIHSKHFYIGPVAGMSYGTNRISTAYTYRDGTESYGSDKTLNGIYKANVAKGTHGLKAGVTLMKNFGIYFSGMYLHKKGIFEDLLDDQNTDKNLGGVNNLDIIPQDYNSHLAGTFSINEGYVLNDNSGWRYTMGLKYTLSHKKEK
jgi:hypothetical protein